VLRVMPAVESARASWSKRVPTAALNGWLRTAVERIPLGSRGVRPPRIRYATQASTKPPHFVFFASARIPAHALRALENGIRDTFDFDGTPVRVSIRVRTRER
jgi:GTP-binding protein